MDRYTALRSSLEMISYIFSRKKIIKTLFALQIFHLFERKLASLQRDTEPRTYVNKLFCSEKNITNIFSEANFYTVALIFFVNTWKFILKQLVAPRSVITSLYSLRLLLSEYRLVITSPSATNC